MSIVPQMYKVNTDKLSLCSIEIESEEVVEGKHFSQKLNSDDSRFSIYGIPQN